MVEELFVVLHEHCSCCRQFLPHLYFNIWRSLGIGSEPSFTFFFINNIVLCVKSSEMLIFSNNNKLLKRIWSPENYNILQSDLSHMLPRCKQNVVDYTCNLHGMPAQQVSVVKDLNVHIGSSFTLKNHLPFIVGSVLRILGVCFTLVFQV